MGDRNETLILGAVAYDPKVVTIWDGFKDWFQRHGLDLDYVLFSNYERQVQAQLDGSIDIAWNSPLAWIRTERAATAQGRSARALAMRDTDRDLTSILLVRAGSAVARPGDLRGLSVAVGAGDSPQATLIPLLHLHREGLRPGVDFRVVRHDLLLGKHGDHIGGEREAVRALLKGSVDAAAIIDGNHLLFSKEGLLAGGSTRIIAQTGPYDHCNFTALDGDPTGRIERFRTLLLAMSYDDPDLRSLFDLEGLNAWLPGRTEGYGLLNEAVDAFGLGNGAAPEWLR